MTTTLDAPARREPAQTPTASQSPGLDELHALESSIERKASRRDGWTLMIFGVAVDALVFSVVAVGFGWRAIDESRRNARAGTPAAAAVAAPAAPASVALSAVTLGDMTVTPSSVTVPSGTYTVAIKNGGMMAHELLVFHTDIAPANLTPGPDGKVPEDAPGFKTSDGENLDPAASQSRVIDLTKAGTYLFVCNLPGHYQAGMHTVVTVR